LGRIRTLLIALTLCVALLPGAVTQAAPAVDENATAQAGCYYPSYSYNCGNTNPYSYYPNSGYTISGSFSGTFTGTISPTYSTGYSGYVANAGLYQYYPPNYNQGCCNSYTYPSYNYGCCSNSYSYRPTYSYNCCSNSYYPSSYNYGCGGCGNNNYYPSYNYNSGCGGCNSYSNYYYPSYYYPSYYYGSGSGCGGCGGSIESASRSHSAFGWTC
jgi:hypothetical protein